MQHRKTSLLAGLLAASTLVPLTAQADTYPSRPIRLVVPYSAGGLPDTVARMLSQRLQEPLGQSLVVENRSGANGAVAATAITTANPDGYTLLVTDGSMLTINPLIIKNMRYDPNKDFVPVSLVANSPLFLAVNKTVKANTFDEFIQLAKSTPAGLNYGSSGVGSTHHLTAEAMKAGLGIKMTHVPFRGSANSIPALVGAQVDMVFSAYPSMAGFVDNGQVRLLATNSPKRSALAPNVPAIAERIPGFNFAVIVAVLAPAGTPPEVVKRLSTEITRIAKRPEVIEQMKIAGIEMVGGSPSDLALALKEESARMTAAAQHAGIQPE